ncbi:MAG: ATP-binding protein [Nocardioidaceae bacterium]
MQHGAGEVTLSARDAAGSVEFHVTDEGAGFGSEMLAHGFERFAHSRSTGGSGLGLAIVAAVAQAHAGSAGVAKRPTGGSDVWIKLSGGASARFSCEVSRPAWWPVKFRRSAQPPAAARGVGSIGRCTEPTGRVESVVADEARR